MFVTGQKVKSVKKEAPPKISRKGRGLISKHDNEGAVN
jgi:hypothetical protein